MELSLNDTINAQINTELWSSYLFLSMSISAESKGYKGIANWFFAQHKKEAADAKKLIDYMNAIDSKIYLYPIEAVPCERDSLLDMFAHKLDHDQKISRLLHVTTSMAEDIDDSLSIEFLTKFAQEQQQVAATSRELYEAFEAAGCDSEAIGLLDKRLGECKLLNFPLL